MPQEMKKVNGRWVVSGSPQSSDLVPFVKPKAAAPKPAAKPAAKPKPKPWWEKLGNDALYEVKQLLRPPLQRNPLQEVGRALTSPLARAVPQQVGLAMVGAVDNTNRMAYSQYQRHVQKKPKADPSAGRTGAFLDQTVDTAYRVLGATPPSQMTPAQRDLDMTRRSIALNVGLAGIPGAGLGALGASTALGGVVRGGAAFAMNEVLSNYLDDNTQGNIVNLVNQLTGAKLPGAVDVGQDDMIDAANKSLIPNAATGLVLGGAVGAGVSAFRNIQRRTRTGRQVQAVQRSRAAQEDAGLIEKDEDGGYRFTEQAQQPPEPPPTAAAPAPAASPMDEFKAANAAMEEQLGMRPPAAALEQKPIPSIADATTENFGNAKDATTQPLPEGDLSADPWGPEYDPSLPESDGLGRVVSELSDAELQTVISAPDLPVVERVNQAVEARAGIESMPPAQAEMVMAPSGALADDYLARLSRKLGGREPHQLRPLFDPDTNPALWARAQSLTGLDDPSQLSKADMVDSLNAMVAEGQAPIVSRLMGGQMLATSEVQAAPLVFQYKGGVNEAGEQIGNSLSGIERWDPEGENIVQVWRDNNGEIGAPGVVYVVNGHNRLAAAKRLGIPSLRVEYLDAPTAAEARLQGAISNVSDGKGTVFDAAKLARESGITDLAQLKALGKPGASGFWRDGISLGRLPEDVFTAAVNEQIPMRRAVIIGESGVDEETMRSAYRYLVQQGPDNVKENTLREMLAMAKSSPAASSVDQPDILTGTEWAQNFNQGMLAKADLAGSVRLMLSKEKKLFGTVGRQAGQIERVGQVDATAAKDISGEASRALAIFDQLKYETGPVGDLLNEGTQRILAGQDVGTVAKGIKNRLAASIQEAMGKEVAPATDVMQEDMFAAAGRADEPAPVVEMTADERAAAEAQLIHQAAANGEIRPPATPIPELPEPAAARLAEALEDLEANGLTPGSKGAQAMADEMRLAVEYGKADALNRWDQEEGLRDAFDYEARSFDEKKDLGSAQGWDDVTPTEVMPRQSSTPIADAFAEQLRSMAESDARLFRTIGEMQQVTRRAIDELSGVAPPPVRPEPLRLTQAAQQPAFTLPEGLGRAAPRYGRATIRFQSDLDRAAYILANDAVKPSKSAPKFREAVEAAGLNTAEVVAHGRRVKAAIKQAAGGGAAPQKAADLDLPAQPWRSSRGDGTQRIRPAQSERSTEEMLGEAKARLDELTKELEALNAFDRKEVELRMPELMEGLRKIVGDDVRIRILDTYKVAKQSKAWGGGDGMADVAGTYELWKDTIHLYRQFGPVSDGAPLSEIPFDELINTGFHESFHRIARVAMPDKDMAILNTPLARLKASKAMADWGSDQATIAYDELLTEAAARVFSARFKGEDPIRAILPTAAGITDDIRSAGPGKALYKAVETIAVALNKVYDFVERSYNLFKGRGFESISSVFDRAARGEMRNTIEDLKLNRITLKPRTFPGMTRETKINYWEDYNVFGGPIDSYRSQKSNFNQELFDFDSMEMADMPVPSYTKVAQQQMRQQIEANNQTMDQIRRKAQQEGC